MARLKVFQARLGFFETIVAAPSKTAALQAWGTHQDLFKDGGAALATAPALVEAALARPGEVLRRAVGSSSAFRPASEPPAELPTPPEPKPKPAAKPAAPAPKPRPPPDRTRLIQAEKALAEADRRFEAARRDIEARREALDAEETDLRTKARRERAGLQRSLEQARTAYEKAGGVN